MTLSQASRSRIQDISKVALLAALALVLSFIETMIPLPVAVPGIKLGLANVAVVVTLFALDRKSCVLVAVIKVLASGFIFGSPMMLAYSAGGTVLALAAMLLLTLIPNMGAVPVSMASAIMHNVGQLAVAALFMGSAAVFATLPLLAVAALITGALTGLVCQATISSFSTGEHSRPVVDLSQLRLSAGSITAFVGLNGSGKTSAALQLAGLAEDQNVYDQEKVGMAFQDPDNQIVNSVVADDVAFGLENDCVEAEDMDWQVERALKRVELLDAKTAEVSHLSGGQKQKVAVAGLLALSPHTLVFDETTSMQDPAARKQFFQVADELCQQGYTVIHITQHLEEAFKAQSIAVFSDGQLLGQATPAQLVDDPSLLESAGLGLPVVAQLVHDLRQVGHDIPAVSSNDELREVLCLS